MNKKQLMMILAILLCFPVLAQAGTVYLRTHRNAKPGEFALPSGVFNSSLNMGGEGEFVTRGLFPKESIIKDEYSRELKGPVGVFDQSSNEFRSTGQVLNAAHGDFKFSLPK